MRHEIHTLLFALIVVAAGSVAGGCASSPTPGVESPDDPWEPSNRSIYGFNDTLDRATLKPIAKGYRKITPRFARQGVSNFMLNLGYPSVFINDFLQGKVRQGGADFARFLVNSTIGIAGFFDVATSMGLKENDEDFGQTLAVWGVPAGPYVMVPFFGPATVRDAPALIVDYFLDMRNYIGSTGVQDKLLIVDIIDLRYRLLSVEDLISDAYDPYLTIRDAWLQRREYLIYDGDPPVDDEFEDEFLDEEFDDESE